jgi:tetratricopeptide (TPR) repeat protein
MTIRNRAASVAIVALVSGASLVSAGCGKYSWGTLSAVKAFKDANVEYARKDWKKAAEKYEEVVKHEDAMDKLPQLQTAYFFLGNSYDQMYKPAKQGDATNDGYIQKAIEYYRKAADKNQDKQWKKSALEYLAAAYGSDKLNDPAKAEPVLIKMIEMEPQEPSNYAVLAKIYEDAGLYDEAEKVLLMSKDAKPKDAAVYLQLAGFYNRQGRFDKTIEALNQRAEIEPNNPEAFQTIAGYYWDETRGDSALTDEQKKDYITKGLEAVDKAISLKPDYVEAITFRGLLLRLQANVEKDPSKQQQLLKEASALSDKANELRKKATGA